MVSKAGMRLFAFAFAFAFSAVVWSCSTNPRNTTPDDTDSSTESDTFEWDTDQDDYVVQVPHLLVEGDCYRRQRTAWDEENIAVSVICMSVAEPYEASVDLLIFPSGMPQEVVHGSYPSVQPDCGGGYLNSVKPYSHNGTYLTLATISQDIETEYCNMVMTSWNTDAEITEGPHSWSDLFHESQYWITPAFPDGPMDPQGRITIASLAPDDVNGDTTDDDNLLHFQIDRFDPWGTHETLLGPVSFPWPELDSLWLMVPWYAAITARGEDNFTLIAPFVRQTDEDPDPPWDLGLIIAQGTASGDVTIEPSVAWTAPMREGMRAFDNVYTFLDRDGTIAVAATVSYTSDSAECITDRLFLLFDLNGELLIGPVEIATSDNCLKLENNEWLSMSGLAWDGNLYGYCDLFEDETTKVYRFLVLDEQGQPLGQPAQVFREIPASQQFLYSCDVVPLGEGDFAVVLSSPAVSAVPDILPGIYVTYVTYQPVW
jgi:hypothetical protein